MYKFELTGPEEGQTKVLLDKYQFVEGVMNIEPANVAEKVKKILCQYYGVTCELVVEKVAAEKTPEVKKTSLAKADTKSA